MIFGQTAVSGVLRIDPERYGDRRGYFARTFCRQEFKKHGINFEPIQCSTSFNAMRGTLRGLHFQTAPQAEDKIVRCTRGAIFDVAVDLRPNSPTFCQVVTEIISAENGIQLYIPKGCAHGFMTIIENSEILYMMNIPYTPGSSSGVPWNDPAFRIKWPGEPVVISDKDRNWPAFN